MEISEDKPDILLTATRLARRKADEFFAELEAEISRTSLGISEGEPQKSVLEPRHLAGGPLRGSWVVEGEESGVSYRWPDANVDEYDRYVRYSGQGDYEGIEAAIGYKENGEIIGFLVTKTGKRGLVFFQKADDFQTSGELLSMIRGGGETGRAGFSPDEPEPSAYSDMTLQSLRDRINGKWNVLAVVAKPDDVEAILGHTARQARLRGLA